MRDFKAETGNPKTPLAFSKGVATSWKRRFIFIRGARVDQKRPQKSAKRMTINWKWLGRGTQLFAGTLVKGPIDQPIIAMVFRELTVMFFKSDLCHCITQSSFVLLCCYYSIKRRTLQSASTLLFEYISHFSSPDCIGPYQKMGQSLQLLMFGLFPVCFPNVHYRQFSWPFQVYFL